MHVGTSRSFSLFDVCFSLLSRVFVCPCVGFPSRTVIPSIPPTIRRVSNAFSFLASAESPPTGVTTIDYRRVWGQSGVVREGDRVAARGCARVDTMGWVASSRFMALAATRDDPTIHRFYNSGRVWGGNTAEYRILSGLFLSCMRDSFFFLAGLLRRCRRPPINPGCPAATCPRCYELAR